MAKLKGRPFLDLLIGYAFGYGFRRFILCTGYKSRVIEGYYKKVSPSIRILFSRESKPLGTAGAVRNAAGLIKSGAFLVMNGDSFCPLDLNKFYRFHKAKSALVSMALSKPQKRAKRVPDCGTVSLDSSRKVTGFTEKEKNRSPYVNAGIYFFKKAALSLIPKSKKMSLEYDLFPKLTGRKFYGYPVDGKLTDIGTPERYKEAKKYL